MKTLVLGRVSTNCYIVSYPNSQEAIVIDPADEADTIEKYLKENDLECKAILLTHGHFDHIMAVPELRKRTNAPVYAHEAEAELLGNPELNASVYMGEEVRVKPDILLKDKEEFQAAGFPLQAIYTPGHTGGGVCYYLREEEMLFAGDTLFFESIGRTDLPTGNHQTLIESIHNKLMVLSENTEVYPGHGRPSTIGHERSFNPYL